MTLRTKVYTGLIYLLILSILAACGPAAPTAEPTTTAAPTQAPTNTLEPTATQAPTETPVPTDPAASADATAATPDPAGAAATLPAAGELPTTTAGQATAAPPAAGSGSAAADMYQYLGQDIADNSQFSPNRPLTITWTVKNAGTTTWTTDYTLRYFSGPKASQDVYNFTKSVAPEGTINFTVTFTTPANPGDYNMWFKLTNAAGQNFGDVNLVYTVTNNPTAATSTPAN